MMNCNSDISHTFDINVKNIGKYTLTYLRIRRNDDLELRCEAHAEDNDKDAWRKCCSENYVKIVHFFAMFLAKLNYTEIVM